ncbi:unnamed protein product [Closterium sp. NIES-65]|nr:unnamed protein product [Closterium sp. NIES-65]
MLLPFDGPIPSSISRLSLLTHMMLSNTAISASIPSTISALSSLTFLSAPSLPPIAAKTVLAGSSCEIQQNDSSFFCKSLCFDFCASCIPLNGQRRHPPPPPPLSPPLPPSLALMRPPSPSLSSLLAVSSPLSLPPAPPPSTDLPTSAIVGISVGVFCLILAAAAAAVVVCGSSRVFTRSRCPQLSMSLVAQATGGRGNDELSTDFQKEVATLWTIRHTNLQRLLGYCWEKPDTALDCELPPDAVGAAAASHAVEQAEEEQVLVFEWVPGGNLHSRLVAASLCSMPSRNVPPCSPLFPAVPTVLCSHCPLSSPLSPPLPVLPSALPLHFRNTTSSFQRAAPLCRCGSAWM